MHPPQNTIVLCSHVHTLQNIHTRMLKHLHRCKYFRFAAYISQSRVRYQSLAGRKRVIPCVLWWSPDRSRGVSCLNKWNRPTYAVILTTLIAAYISANTLGLLMLMLHTGQSREFMLLRNCTTTTTTATIWRSLESLRRSLFGRGRWFSRGGDYFQ